MSQNKVIALDIGGVCLQIRPERCFGLLGYRAIEEVPPELLQSIDRFERGHLTEDEFLARFRQVTNSDLSDDFVRNAWNAILHAPIEGMADQIRRWQSDGFRVVFFSDTSTMHMRDFRKRFPEIAGLVPDGIYSFIVGAKKPEPAMFIAFEADYGKPAIYFDDREVCLAGGRAAGWPVHRFESVAGLPAIELD